MLPVLHEGDASFISSCRYQIVDVLQQFLLHQILFHEVSKQDEQEGCRERSTNPKPSPQDNIVRIVREAVVYELARHGVQSLINLVSRRRTQIFLSNNDHFGVVDKVRETVGEEMSFRLKLLVVADGSHR